MEYLNDQFYKWACGKITNSEFKSILRTFDITVDLRQADLDNTLTCYDGKNEITLEC